jgi:hypothetical protein
MRTLLAIGLSGVLLASIGCAKFGYTDRVLHRVQSPDGLTIAVCQEVPMFDGPEFDVRLERRDGIRIRELFHMGDGGGCDELIWSPDGRTLAVLTGHTATIRIADVDWALAHPEIHERHWVYRDFSFSSDKVNKRATDLRFVSAFELEFQLCEYSLRETQANNGQIRCGQQAQPQRLRIPSPLIAGRPA